MYRAFCQLSIYSTSIILSNSSPVTFSFWNNAIFSLSFSSGRSHHLSSWSLEILYSFSLITLLLITFAGLPPTTVQGFTSLKTAARTPTTAPSFMTYMLSSRLPEAVSIPHPLNRPYRHDSLRTCPWLLLLQEL